MLESAGINATICFKYDDIYFPYIVLWIGSNKVHYQLFYKAQHAVEFYDMLASRGKTVELYRWSTSKLQYQ